MHQRTLAIINKLINKDEFLTVKNISIEFGVSKKSIYNTIEDIDNFLKTNNIDLLIRDKTKGFKLFDFPKNKEDIYPIILHSIDVFSKEYRVLYEVIMLASSSKPITVDLIANSLNVSRNTIINDCTTVKTMLKEFQLVLTTEPFVGITIVGSERNKRDLMVEIISKNLGYERLLLENFISEISLSDVEHIIISLEQKLEIQFSDESYKNLQIYLFITLYRMKHGEILEQETSEVEMHYNKEYRASSEVYEIFFQKYQPVAYHVEIQHLAKQLLTLKSIIKNKNQVYFDDWFKYQSAVWEFLNEISKSLCLPISSDHDLFYNLIIHIRSAYYRMKFNFRDKNTINLPIFEEYKKIYDLVIRHLYIIEEKLDITFNQDEIAYIVMYIGGYITNTKIQNGKKKTVAIVCSSGTSTAWILKKQIQNAFNVSIYGVYSVRNLDYLCKNAHVDHIITTIDHVQCEKPCHFVNPILTKEDYATLANIFESVDEKQAIYNMVVDIAKNYVPPNVLLSFITEIEKTFSTGGVNVIQQSLRREPMLKELITKEVILVNQVISNHEDAIRMGGKLLLDQGLIEERYIDGMIESLHEHGPYIVIAPGIAIPHARVDCGSKGIGLSIMTLKDPIKFGHETNDPVKLVICLCAIDHDSHLVALSELVDILDNEENLELIYAAKTPEDILQIIKKEDL